MPTYDFSWSISWAPQQQSVQPPTGEPPPPPFQPPPVAPPVVTDPCAGKKGSLDFNGRVGQDWGIDHIEEEHITTSNPMKSRYIFQFYNQTRERRRKEVMRLDRETFESGGAYPQFGGRTAYVYAFAQVGINDDWSIFYNVGVDATAKIPGSQTNVNTVVVADDCKTVITSFPGLPADASPSNPNIGGWTPRWRSGGLTFRW